MIGYLIDTGPLIALLDRSDRHHQWAIRTIDELRGSLLTCESVLSEAWDLVRRGGADPTLVVDLAERLRLKVLTAWAPRTGDLLRRYRDRASVADATLLALVEEEPDRVVVTTDVEGYSVYRIHGRQAVPTIMPPA